MYFECKIVIPLIFKKSRLTYFRERFLVFGLQRFCGSWFELRCACVDLFPQVLGSFCGAELGNTNIYIYIFFNRMCQGIKTRLPNCH